LNILLAWNIAMFKEFIYNFIRFVYGLLSDGIENQISHFSEAEVNTRIKLPTKSLLSLIFQVCHDHIIEKSFRKNLVV
jgi:hypothetical protein